MAEVLYGVASSHVPAIGAAIDNGKEDTPYWRPLFEGYEGARKWMADADPDVIILQLRELGNRGEDSIRSNLRVSEMVEVDQVGLEALPHVLEYSGPAAQLSCILGVRELVENTVGHAGFVFITRVKGDLPLLG